MPSYSYSRPSYSYSRPSYSYSRPATSSYRPAFGTVPLRTYNASRGIFMPSAMQLNRYNITGTPSGPRALSPNLSRAYSNIYASTYGVGTTGSGRFGPRVPSASIGGLSNFRNWHNTSQNAVQRDMFARQAMIANQPPIVKYRNPRTGEISDTPFSNLSLNRFGNNQNWRYQRNSAGQSPNRGYSSRMSQFAINAPSGVGLNRMR